MGDTRIDYLAGQTLVTDVLAAQAAIAARWSASGISAPATCRVRDFVKWFAHQSGMGPYYDAPMVDDDQPVHGAGLHHRRARPTRGRVRRATKRRNDAPFWLQPQFHRAALSVDRLPSEGSSRTSTRDCAFESCPDEPPHPWFIGGKPAVERGRARAARKPDRLLRRGHRHGRRDRPRPRRARAAKGSRESTLVVFMSDNGMNCGHHGIWGKGNGTRPQNMYDTSVKVPCIVAQPGRIPAGRVERRAALRLRRVSHAGRITSALRTRRARPKPGRSFRASSKAAPPQADDEVVVYDEYGPVRMVRTRDWKYVHRYPDGPHELFDLRADPGERDNRIDEPRPRRRSRGLRDRLETWFDRYVDPARDGVDKGVTGCGQVGPRRDRRHAPPRSRPTTRRARTGTCGSPKTSRMTSRARRAARRTHERRRFA